MQSKLLKVAMKSSRERSFLLLHGWQNRRPFGHWQRWLAHRLTVVGCEAIYPQLPNPDYPDLECWLTDLGFHLDMLHRQDRTVICHSLACLLWLHAAARNIVKPAVDRVLLVAPPSGNWLVQHTEVSAFNPPVVTRFQLFAASKYTRIVASENDIYCPEGALALYARPLNIPADLLPGAGHLDMDAGYGPWQSLLSWCLSPGKDVAIHKRTVV